MSSELYPHAETRHVDGLARELFAPLLGVRLAESGWEVTSWDCEQGLCLTIEHRGGVLLFEFEARNDGLEAFERTEHFNVNVRRILDGKVMTAIERRLASRMIEVIRRREGLLPVIERPSSSRKIALREIVVDRVLIPEGQGQYYINPYVGCMIGCDFCYVIERADFSRALEGLPSQPWGSYLDVKVNAAEVLAREVTTAAPGPVRFSPILTDPYQGPERRYRITRCCLEVLLEYDFVPVLLTRSALVTRDLDLLKRFKRCAVGLSIPTDDDRMRTIFEPGGDPIEARFEALETLHAAGIPTFAVVQPMLPMNVERVVERLAPVIQSVRVDRMHFAGRVRHLYEEHDLMWALEDRFFEETRARILEPLRAAGVGVDEMDDMAALIGG